MAPSTRTGTESCPGPFARRSSAAATPVAFPCTAATGRSSPSAERERVRHLILDLRGLKAVDTDALRELLGEWAEERRDGLVLILVRVPKTMRPLLQQTGLDHQLPISYEGVSLFDGQPAQR